MRYDYIKTIRRMVSGRDVCEMYGVKLTDKGFAHCLFHSERTASMKVYDGEKGFYCFGCGARGDSLDLVEKLFNLSTDEAARKLNEDFSLRLPICEDLPKARQIEVGKILFKNRQKHRHDEAKRQAVMDDYFAALDLFVACQMAIKRFAPKSQDEALNPLFIYGCHNIARAEHELEVQETRRWEYDNRNRDRAMDNG